MNNLNETLQLLSDKVNIPFSKLYSILKNQMLLDTKFNIFWIFISICIFITAYMKIKKNYNFIKTITQYREEHKEFWFIILWISLILIFSIVSIYCIVDLVQIKTNPDYYMFKLLLQTK